MSTAMRCLFAGLFIFASSAVRAEEVLDNAAVIRMVRAGLSPDVIELKVKGTAAKYDVTADGLIALKTAGVPDGVLAAMLKKAESAPAATSSPAAATPPPATAAAASQPAAAAVPAAVAAPAPVTQVPQAPALATDPEEKRAVCAKATYATGIDPKASYAPARVCVVADAFTIDQQRIPFASVIVFCREKSLGFPYTADPDEWWFSDGKVIYKVRGSERDMTALDEAAVSRLPATQHGACSSRSVLRQFPGQK